MGKILIDPGLYFKIRERLQFIYKENYTDELSDKISALISKYNPGKSTKEKWDNKDIVLITYGDSVFNESELPLKTLKRFLDKNMKDEVSIVHILPFFPFSSDGGFSIIDFRKVNPRIGTWDDIKAFNRHYDLMIDLVINHISSKSNWFHNFLSMIKPYDEYFITENPKKDLSDVVRPRSSMLLTPYHTSDGIKHLWTTFSPDQIDLNYKTPALLLEIIEIVLDYVSKGARIIRMDAVAYLWKEPGTTCLHLPETHEIIKLFRDILEYINPKIILLTETNVPNKENLSYFGDGDEAHMIYQFSLPPLLLHALQRANSTYLNQWAQTIPETKQNCTFFNFTASHDGIGIRPLEGLLPEEEKNDFIKKIQEFGALISYKSNKEENISPYEMNITYFDALKGTDRGIDNLQFERFIASQIIMMSFKGIPAFYLHNFTATSNDYEGVQATRSNRAINRKKWNENELNQLLVNKTIHSRTFNELKRLIRIRKGQKAFHPDGPQEIIFLDKKIFSLVRKSVDKSYIVLLISNLSNHSLNAKVPDNYAFLDYDLIENKHTGNIVNLSPYQCVWLVRNK